MLHFTTVQTGQAMSISISTCVRRPWTEVCGWGYFDVVWYGVRVEQSGLVLVRGQDANAGCTGL